MRDWDLLEGVAAVQGRDERTSSRAASQERDSLTTNLPPCKDGYLGPVHLRSGWEEEACTSWPPLIMQLCLESDWGALP